MPHAQHAVAALHGKETEGAHDVGTQRSEGAVGNFPADSRQVHGDSVPAEAAAGGINPLPLPVDVQRGHGKTAGPFRPDHLDESAAFACPGMKATVSRPF